MILERAAKHKKDTYLEACLARWRSFIRLVYLMDGMACNEAKTYKKRIVLPLVKKCEQR